MKKLIFSTLIIIVLAILTALIFDWGRRGESLQDNVSSVPQDYLLTTNTPIIVNNIKDNQEVSSPVTITGEARGNWFFEASFPIKLVDLNGKVIATAIAKAESDWMTTEFVNFSATLEYTKSTTTNQALIVLSKDNPSGNPESDQSIFIPVILK
jgi:hypothetical protein